MTADRTRVALVTYATRYAGEGAVSALLAAGHAVVCHDDSFGDDAARAAFEARFPGATACNARTPGGAVARAIELHDRIDTLVSNDVYPAQYLRVEACEAADLRRAAEAMLVTPMTVVARVATEMKKRGGGRIVLITSAASRRPEPGFSIYSSIRAGASAFAQAAARELAPHRIIVNAIAPNYLASETYYPTELWGTDEAREKLRQLLPAGRLCTQAEIGALIAFLAGGTCDFLTGDVLELTGGWP